MTSVGASARSEDEDRFDCDQDGSGSSASANRVAACRRANAATAVSQTGGGRR